MKLNKTQSVELFKCFSSEELSYEYLVSKRVFDNLMECLRCGGKLSVCLKTRIYRCVVKGCRARFPIWTNQILAGLRLELNRFLLVAFMWCNGLSHTQMTNMTGLSKTTLTKLMNYFDEVVGLSLDSEDQLIGGENIIVEVDESKFGKRKYNRGHRVDGIWVVGGVERTPERKFFVVKTDRRDRNSLLAILSRHVRRGSILITDCWRGYSGIDVLLGVEHHTINHSVRFVDELGVIHTNTMEGTWSMLKEKTPRRKRTRSEIDGVLLKRIWMRKHKGRIWDAFLECFSYDF